MMPSNNNSFLRRIDESDGVASTPPAGFAQTDVQSAARLSQILDENDHRRCTASNHRDLMKAKLLSLKGLTEGIRADNWMYEGESRQPEPSFHLNPTTATRQNW
jgi:hypothetical protein